MFDYAEEAFTLEQISELSGDALVEFGAPWCGHCQAASPAIKEAVTEHAGLRHIKIYDDKGKRLGRAFKVKLWPTLILLEINGVRVFDYEEEAFKSKVPETLKTLEINDKEFR